MIIFRIKTYLLHVIAEPACHFRVNSLAPFLLRISFDVKFKQHLQHYLKRHPLFTDLVYSTNDSAVKKDLKTATDVCTIKKRYIPCQNTVFYLL